MKRGARGAVPAGGPWTPRSVTAAIGADPSLDDWWPVRRSLHATQGTDPGEEIVIGAVLTQSTRWRNVERALDALADRHALSLAGILGLSDDELRKVIRPAGFAVRKATTLVDVATALSEFGTLETARVSIRDDPDPVRDALLGIVGVGPETADAILNFALDAPVFVVDAYTRRLMGRLGVRWRDPRVAGSAELDPATAPYDAVARWWVSGLPRDASVYRCVHAAIVEHMKDPCTKTAPGCASCPCAPRCAYPRELAKAPADIDA